MDVGAIEVGMVPEGGGLGQYRRADVEGGGRGCIRGVQHKGYIRGEEEGEGGRKVREVR